MVEGQAAESGGQKADRAESRERTAESG